MAGKIVPAVFGDLAMKIVAINFKCDGRFKHEPNPLIEKNLAQVKAAVKRQKCNFGVCFDGDADRLMMVDEKGKTIGCDLLTALMAGYLAGFNGGKIWLGKAGAATDLIERQIQLLTLLPYYLPQRHSGNFTTKDFKHKRKV